MYSVWLAFMCGMALVLGLATGTTLLAGGVAVATALVSYVQTNPGAQRATRMLGGAVFVLLTWGAMSWLLVEFFTTEDPICDGCPGH